jgi:hypothetical protein
MGSTVLVVGSGVVEISGSRGNSFVIFKNSLTTQNYDETISWRQRFSQLKS